MVKERVSQASLFELIEIRCGFNFETGHHGELQAEFDKLIKSTLLDKPNQIVSIFKQMFSASANVIERRQALFSSYIISVLDECWTRDSEREFEFAIKSPHFIEIMKCIHLRGDPNSIVGSSWASVFSKIANMLTSSGDLIAKGSVQFLCINQF